MFTTILATTVLTTILPEFVESDELRSDQTIATVFFLMYICLFVCVCYVVVGLCFCVFVLFICAYLCVFPNIEAKAYPLLLLQSRAK